MTDFLQAELDDGRLVWIDPLDVVAVSQVFIRDQRGPDPKVDERNCEVVTRHGTYRLHSNAAAIAVVIYQGTTPTKEVSDG